MIYRKRYQPRECYEGIEVDEWTEFEHEITTGDPIIIYGAGKYADVLVECLTEMEGVGIAGIAVSEDVSTGRKLKGHKVQCINRYDDFKDTPVLIATREVHHQEIFDLLDKKGFTKIIPIYQSYMDRLIEMYLRCKTKNFGIDLGVLDIFNTRSFIKNRYQNVNNEFSDLVGNIKVAMYKKATEEAAQFVIEHMLDAGAYENRHNMFSTALSQTEEGLYLEFGVAGGNSTRDLAAIRSDRQFYCFDSFEGMPGDWNSGVTGFKKGDIRQANLPDVPSNVSLVVGYFDETLPGFMEEHKEKIAFIHLDCTLYSSARYIFDTLGNRIEKGTIIVINSFFNVPGWQKNGEYSAFMEFIESSGLKFEYLGYVYTDMQVAIRILGGKDETDRS